MEDRRLLAIGLGDGTFREQAAYQTGSGPVFMDVADLNHDSRLDAVVGSGGDAAVSVLLGNGNGTFQPQVEYQVNGVATSAAVVDMSWDAGMYVPGNSMLVVGTASGDVLKIDLASGSTVASVNLDSTAIGHIDLVDLDNNGADEILATHESGSSRPTYALRANGLSTIWQTDRPTGCSTGTEVMGGKVWSGDFDGDGVIELVIPTTNGYDNLLQVFSAETGQRESVIPQDGYNYLPSVYYNRADENYHLFASRNPNNNPWYNYARVYDLTNGNALEWENTSVNTWKRGAISESMIDGLPRLWGGWYGRTLSVMNASGNALWTKSFGGGYEAEGSYGGDLRGDGVETVLVAGTTGGAPRVDAANLATGATLWTFSDPGMYWSASVLAAEDANGDGVKEVFVGGGGPRSRFQVLNGANGQRIWSQDVPTRDLMNFTQLIDVDDDGDREVLLAFGNTIQARDAMTGSLVKTYTFSSKVSAFAAGVLGQTVPDIKMSSATTEDSKSVTIEYQVSGFGEFQVGVYRSENDVWDSGDERVGFGVVTPGIEHTATIPATLPIDPSRPYVLVVADPDNVLQEANEGNNTESFRQQFPGIHKTPAKAMLAVLAVRKGATVNVNPQPRI